MQESGLQLVEEFMQKLNSLRTTLKYLKKVPTFYKKRYLNQIRKLVEIHKQLTAKLLETRKKGVRKISNEMNKFLESISSERISPEEKINIIERFEIKAIDVDIKRLLSRQVGILPFPEYLIKKLRKNFTNEIEGLRIVYGKHGDCTAFLLRKILEKALFLALVKTGFKEENLKDKSEKKYIGLEKLLDVASNWKVKGVPLLMPKTVKNVKGIKFLGDVAAHNYLANVDMEEIVLHIPYLTTALKELSRWLNCRNC